MKTVTIYNTGKTTVNTFGNLARRSTTTSYAEILSQTVEKNPADMTLDEYRSYFAQRVTDIAFHRTRSNDVELIRVSDAALKKCQADPDYAERIFANIAHERATPNQLQGLYSNGEMKIRYIEADEKNCRVVSTEDANLANLRFDVNSYIFNGNKSLIRRLKNARQDLLATELFRQAGTLQTLKLQRYLID